MNSPLITVLITTYNYGQFIEEAIDSALAQDFPLDRVEIVVVDDGSTDDTSERIKKYGSRIRYFYQANGGQAAALNAGFANARGEIICLLDADDYFLPGKLQCVGKAFEKDPALGMVYHPYQEWNAETNERRETTFPLASGDIHTVPKLFYLYYPHPTSCVSYRRSALNRLLPIPENIHMLADAYPTNLVPFVSPILALPAPLIVYRVHGKNHYYANERQMPLETRRRRRQQWQIVISAMRDWLARNGFSRKQLPVRSFLGRWNLHQQKERFQIAPPGRFRFFRFVVSENYVSSPVQTWKLTAFNYLFALFVFAFGYQRADQFYNSRARVMAGLQRVVRFLSRQNPHHTVQKHT